MQVENRHFILKTGKNVILRLVYFSRFCLQCRKRLLSFKKLSLLGIVLLMTIFSFSQINNREKSLDKQPLSGTNSGEKMTVETGLPAVTEKTTHDFQIAAWREPEDDILDLSDESEIALIFGGSALVAPETEISEEDIPHRTRTEIETYVVQPGDTISTIAQMFGLNWNTIFWTNNLNYWSVIKPGNELKILPTNGLLHTVKKGENLSFIANKYKALAEKIAEINDLDEGSSLQPGMILIIPDGTPPPIVSTKPKSVTSTKPQLVQEDYSDYWDWRKNTDCHLFVSRQCTDWTAFKWASEQGQCVPSWSHARYWFKNAQRDGYETSDKPLQGAIIALTCTSWICGYYGHVAYVEDFDETTVTISEMNGLKRLAQSTRSLRNATNQWQSGWKILGYIYPKK